MKKKTSEDFSDLASQCDEMGALLKSLAHPTRLKILCQLISSEKNVGELQSGCSIAQSAMSQFLGRMRDEGVLTSRREAQHVFYSIQDERLKKLLTAIKEIYCA